MNSLVFETEDHELQTCNQFEILDSNGLEVGAYASKILQFISMISDIH